MRSALRVKAQEVGARVSASQSYPAPTGGWNARDALPSMQPNEAVVLDNWFPATSYCEIRGGWTSHATGMSGNGKTLMTYNALSGTNKMFCSTATGVYDVSSAGAVGASVAARTNGKHQWWNFGDGTNNYLMMFNGVDKPLYCDGTNWIEVDGASSPALTGVTTTNLIGGFTFKGRLILLEKNTLAFWYLAAGAAGGALTKYDLSGDAPRGGYIMAAASWTMDGGAGIDDHAVFITSEGDVLIYKGTNPSAANTWEKVGTFSIERPIGRQCVMQYGADILIITTGGVFLLGQLIASKTVDRHMALSYKIENAFVSAANSFNSVFGWGATLYPVKSALIINVPNTEDGIHYQYVMNTITKAWCRFTDWAAEDFVTFNNDLYFCSGTAVVKAWTGAVDGASNITAYGKTAFSYFGYPGAEKDYKLFRPVLAVNGSLTFTSGVDIDFRDVPLTGTSTYSVVSGGVWDSSNWDSAYWAAGLEVTKEWTTPSAYVGRCAAGKLRIATNSLTVQWLASDYIYEMGVGF